MKEIIGYEALYAITEDGKVWSHRTKQFLTPMDNGNGYLYVRLMKDGKMKNKYVHRLVAENYIPNPENKPCVSHLDECRTHNVVENLAWATYAENNNMPLHKERMGESLRNNKKTSKKVYCVELDRVFPSLQEASRQMGVTASNISRVCRGNGKTCAGYHWRYYED